MKEKLYWWCNIYRNLWGFCEEQEDIFYNDILKGILYDEISRFSPGVIHGNLSLVN